jgi:hypothetical protein
MVSQWSMLEMVVNSAMIAFNLVEVVVNVSNECLNLVDGREV